MYKLMIVEDEPILREGLKHYFNWEEFRITQISAVENGKVGIETALHEKPDLIITDIRMPELDGLEMIKQLRSQLPNTIFIILTGYNDFKYAQKAISYGGVYDYLLKPLHYDEGFKTINNCIHRLDEQRLELERRSKIENDSKRNLKHKGSQIVKELLEGDSFDENDFVSLYKLDDSNFLYQTLVLTCIPDNISFSKQEQEWWRKNAENIIAKIVHLMIEKNENVYITSYFYKLKLYTCIMYPIETKPISASEMDLEFTELLARTTEDAKMCLFLAVGEPVSTLLQVKNSFKFTDQTLYRRFFEHKRLIFLKISTKNNEVSNEISIQLENRDKDRILNNLYESNTTKIHITMKNLSEKLQYTSTDYFFTYLHEIISIVLNFANKNNILIDGVYHEKILSLDFVDSFASIEDLFEWLASWMSQLSKGYSHDKKGGDSQEDQLFQKIKEFIIKNIDQDVSLNRIAEHFFYNPSYLSRLFKTKLDINYKTFVTEVKMNYAKQCLAEPHHSISDVCEMCGYKSYKHFVKLFKSMTHVTPTEYRKRLWM